MDAITRMRSASAPVKPKKAKKEKTFNRLEPRFQITKDHDPNHIFEEEKQMIGEMRSKSTLFNGLDDKVLLTFLFARRHNVELATSLLENHMRVREKAGYKDKLPTAKDAWKILSQGATIRQAKTCDKYGRMLYYYFIQKDFPKGRDIKDYWAVAFYDCYKMIEEESLATLRNGLIIVVDFENFGWRNVDLSSQGREINQSMTSVFPKRVRGMYVVNGGLILKAALKAGSVVLPKKMMKRIKTISLSELKDLVPNEHLHSKFGGSLALSEDYENFTAN